MKAIRVKISTKELMDPANSAWGGPQKQTFKMEVPPIGNVPSNYFRALDPTKIGAVTALDVCALHNGESLFFRLSWQDPSEDVSVSIPGKYRDGAGILFPFLESARINNMGSKKEPVNAWCWQAGIEQPHNVTAAGLGTSMREEKSYCEAGVKRDGEKWTVVISRPFNVPEEELNVALSPGMTKKVGFAVWEGGNGERAGAKSFCGNWYEVEIES